MAGTTGRPNPTYGWNAYDWCQDQRYTTTAFAALTFTPTQTTAQATVTISGVPAAGSKVGLFYGTGMGAGGYDSKTRLVAGPTASITMRELKPNTLYHVAPYAVGGDGTTYIGPNAQVTTPS
jgi:hypothetical protein